MTIAPVALSRPVGLDLSDPATYKLVRRMYWKRFNARVRYAGIDEEDGFQEVLLGLVRRQAGKSRFDPSRSSMSNYLFLAMTGITRNLADSARRHSRSVLGGESDAAESCAVEADRGDPTDRTYDDLAAEMEVPVGLVRALAEGQDPFVAAMSAGMGFVESAALVDSLGLR